MTYGQLLEKLQKLTPGQLAQKAVAVDDASELGFAITGVEDVNGGIELAIEQDEGII